MADLESIAKVHYRFAENLTKNTMYKYVVLGLNDDGEMKCIAQFRSKNDAVAFTEMKRATKLKELTEALGL